MMRINITKKILLCMLSVALLTTPCMGALASEGDTNITLAQTSMTSSVEGVKSDLPGVYLASGVNGIVNLTDSATIAENYGLASGEKPYARISDMDGRKSYLAQLCIDNVAKNLGAAVGPAIDAEIGKMTSDGFCLLPEDGATITLRAGIPRSFTQEGKTFAVVAVRPGGNVLILNDMDDNPETVTFDTTAGQAVYALIKY